MTDGNRDDEAIEGLQAAERRRRGRTLLAGGVVAVLVVGAFVVSFLFKDELFQPEIDIESGQKEVIADTNDPQCRAFIADVTVIGSEYRELEPTVQEQMIGDDPAAIQELVDDLQKLRGRLEDAEETSVDANLRFDNSRTEVEDWFDYVDNELNLLQKVGTDRLADLKAGSAEDAGAATPDAGTVVEQAPTEEPKSDKTLQERLDGATLAANEAFQKFRVWHTGGLHPCGAADEGETPWQPKTE